ncbi:MAG: hypothetical protein F6K17_36135, partial [Okeania sp. SIO3C4]|nr:hypothetical protein [Okeania sp. SIO3C4]
MLPYSTIEIQSQILGVALDIPGTPFSLHYSSDRHPGRQAAYTLTIPLTGEYVPSDVQRVELEISVGQQLFRQSFPPKPNQQYTFTWDGKDADGKIVGDRQRAKLRTSYIYPPPKSAQTKEATTTVGTGNALNLGLGGWSI